MTRKTLGFFILVLLTLITAPLSHAQQSPAPPAPAASSHETAPVVIDGKTLFSVRGVQAFPAAERAASVEERIRKVADNPGIKTDSIVAVETGLTTDIVAGDEHIISLVDS